MLIFELCLPKLSLLCIKHGKKNIEGLKEEIENFSLSESMLRTFSEVLSEVLGQCWE